jgi:hypothetical protein
MPLKSCRARPPLDTPVFPRRPCVDEESASLSGKFTSEIKRPLHPNEQKAGAPKSGWK